MYAYVYACMHGCNVVVSCHVMSCNVCMCARMYVCMVACVYLYTYYLYIYIVQDIHLEHYLENENQRSHCKIVLSIRLEHPPKHTLRTGVLRGT